MKRELLVEDGLRVFVTDELGNSRLFNTFAEFQVITGIDLTGKDYIDYSPDEGIYIDNTDDTVTIPNSEYDTVISSIKDPYYGMTEQEAKDDKLVADLQAVDDWVLSEQSKTFTYDGHNYYPDERSLNAMLTSMEYKPAEFTKEWKTADKEVDGISNVYVVLNKTEITELALTLEQRQSQIWDEGDAKKKLIKEEYNQ